MPDTSNALLAEIGQVLGMSSPLVNYDNRLMLAHCNYRLGLREARSGLGAGGKNVSVPKDMAETLLQQAWNRTKSEYPKHKIATVLDRTGNTQRQHRIITIDYFSTDGSNDADYN